MQTNDKPKWLGVAEGELAKNIHEIPGSTAEPRIIEYNACTTLKATSDEVPWCSAFANFCMTRAGVKGTNSAAARSWLDWGTVITEPVPGCIVVMRRGNDPHSGHVGFFVSKAGGFIKVLGGNQSDSVKYANFPETSVLGYRLP